ncbi:phage tail protein [Acidovorax sp. Be4]|uniref:Phage tail protein n=1 Tax=Acidovorax bellezanensis TaxID=2976702 RepID=A0ABT2PPL1_9BURK|nr:phage tail protein [Acidovorax sp. Be4]MCT9812409.1 phage tail protein [Acidovorax sp. Be4]
MLTILNDPTGTLGLHRYAWDFSKSLQDNIAQHLESGVDCKVLVNGLEIDPLTEPRMDALPSIADFVTVVRCPGVAIPAAAMYWLAAAAVAAAVIVIATMPKPPDVSGAGKDSPNNSLTAQTNRARAYQAIPDVYGYRRVWPDLIQPSTVEYIDNIKYVTEWLCISRGIGDITSVNYAETPIGDIDGASYEVFAPAASGGYPEFSTTTLADVLETFASDEVNGQELGYSVPYPAIVMVGSFAAVTGETTFTITLPDGPLLDQLKGLAPGGTALVKFEYSDISHEAVLFNQICTVQSYAVAAGNATFTFGSTEWLEGDAEPGISFTITPNGATQTANGPYTLPVDGDRIRWNAVFLRGLKGAVAIRAEWWKIDGAGAEIPGTRQSQNDTYSADTYDQRFYTTQVTPSAGHGRYRVQFTRLTAQIGEGGSDVAKLEELYAVRHYGAKVLPGVTVIRVTTKATAEATGFSDRKFNLRWHRHVRTLTTDTLGASRNFARAMAHIWTIAGSDIAQLDVEKLAAINAEFGEASDLLRFDASLDDADMSLGERMQLAADSARCVLWRDGQKWTVTRDQARAYPELQLDYRNLASTGDSAISYAAHLPASNDGVELEYVDEASQSKKSYIRLDIASGAVIGGQSANPKKIKLSACATAAQAVNRAQLEARRLLYQRVSVSDTALSDGGSLGLGSLVRWIDPNDFAGDDGLQAGEVMSIDGNLIATSEPVDWKGETEGRILFTGANGAHLGAPVQCYPAGSGIQLASVPAGIYIASADRQLGSRYAFAVGLTSAEVESAGLYTVTSIKPESSGKVSLALAAYDSRIYGADA